MAQILYELLRSILTFTELTHIFEKKVITLVCMHSDSQLNPNFAFRQEDRKWDEQKLNKIFFLVISQFLACRNYVSTDPHFTDISTDD